jgi:hypothetical protein
MPIFKDYHEDDEDLDFQDAIEIKDLEEDYEPLDDYIFDGDEDSAIEI